MCELQELLGTSTRFQKITGPDSIELVYAQSGIARSRQEGTSMYEKSEKEGERDSIRYCVQYAKRKRKRVSLGARRAACSSLREVLAAHVKRARAQVRSND